MGVAARRRIKADLLAVPGDFGDNPRLHALGQDFKSEQ
jgi:hypothetical protein